MYVLKPRVRYKCWSVVLSIIVLSYTAAQEGTNITVEVPETVTMEDCGNLTSALQMTTTRDGDRMLAVCSTLVKTDDTVTWVVYTEGSRPIFFHVSSKNHYAFAEQYPPGLKVGKTLKTGDCGQLRLTTHMNVSLRLFEGYDFTCYHRYLNSRNFVDLEQPDAQRSDVYRHPVYENQKPILNVEREADGLLNANCSCYVGTPGLLTWKLGRDHLEDVWIVSYDTGVGKLPFYVETDGVATETSYDDRGPHMTSVMMIDTQRAADGSESYNLTCWSSDIRGPGNLTNGSSPLRLGSAKTFSAAEFLSTHANKLVPFKAVRNAFYHYFLTTIGVFVAFVFLIGLAFGTCGSESVIPEAPAQQTQEIAGIGIDESHDDDDDGNDDDDDDDDDDEIITESSSPSADVNSPI